MDGEPFEERVGLADHLDDLLLRIEHGAARVRPLALAGLVVAIAAAVGWWSWRALSAGPPVEDLIPLAAADGGTATPAPPSASPGSPADGSPTAAPTPVEETPGELVVHVVGAIRRPGLVTLPEGARISDALEAAGGPLADADPDRLNLASPVVDGMQIRVPTVGTVDDAPAGEEGDPEALVRLPEGGAGQAGSGSGPVDLNLAAATELESLPGIGPALAGAIVGWRTDHGPFATVDDLQAVPGIGPAKLAALRDLVSV